VETLNPAQSNPRAKRRGGRGKGARKNGGKRSGQDFLIGTTPVLTSVLLIQ